MTNILSVLFYRLRKSKLFWVMFGVTAALPMLGVLFLSSIGALLTSLAGEDVGYWEILRQFNLTTAELSSYGSLLYTPSLLAVITSSIFLSREFSYGTYRNVLLANRSRLELYASHLIVSLVIGMGFMGASMTSAVIFYGAVFGFYQMTALQAFIAVLTAFAMGCVAVVFVQLMMCMFLFCTRRLAVALSCPIVICLFAPGVFSSLAMIIDAMNLFSSSEVNLDPSWIPLYNAELLDVSNVDGPLIGKILLYLVPLSVLFGFMGWVGFRKSNLK